MQKGFCHNEKSGVHFLSVPSFDKTGLCLTAFSTRLGGVSKPPLESMNLGFGRGDVRETVIENYRRFGDAAGFPYEKLVAFTQVHKSDVCVADESFVGEAFRENKREFDAIVTNIKGLPIATYHADCVPVYLLDPVKKAVGVAHAGWRGTALSSPVAAAKKMCEKFSSKPSDILVGVGPAISKANFETDPDVPEAMVSAFGDDAREFIEDKGNGKYLVSLPDLCVYALKKFGIPDENITLSDECTYNKSDLYWSHRKTHGIRGAMAAVIMLV